MRAQYGASGTHLRHQAPAPVLAVADARRARRGRRGRRRRRRVCSSRRSSRRAAGAAERPRSTRSSPPGARATPRRWRRFARPAARRPRDRRDVARDVGAREHGATTRAPALARDETDGGATATYHAHVDARRLRAGRVGRHAPARARQAAEANGLADPVAARRSLPGPRGRASTSRSNARGRRARRSSRADGSFLAGLADDREDRARTRSHHEEPPADQEAA